LYAARALLAQEVAGVAVGVALQAVNTPAGSSVVTTGAGQRLLASTRATTAVATVRWASEV
jgi:hypothetical protein